MSSWLMLAFAEGGYLVGVAVLAVVAYRVVRMEDEEEARSRLQSRQTLLLCSDLHPKSDRADSAQQHAA